MSNCVQRNIREIPESSLSETVCTNLSEGCGGTCNGSLVKKLKAPMDVVHCSVWKRTRHLIASSQISFLRSCQWFLVPEFFDYTKYMFQTNRKLSFRNNLLISWYMGHRLDNLCPQQAGLLQTLSIPSLLLRLIFVVIKNDILDSGTTYPLEKNNSIRRRLAYKLAMPNEVIRLVSQSGTTLLISNFPFLGKNYPTSQWFKEI